MTSIPQLRELHQQARTAPWLVRYVADDPVGDEFYVVEDPEGYEVASGLLGDENDLRLIAAMRNALPYLLDLTEAAQRIIGSNYPDHDDVTTIREALNQLEQGGFGG